MNMNNALIENLAITTHDNSRRPEEKFIRIKYRLWLKVQFLMIQGWTK